MPVSQPSGINFRPLTLDDRVGLGQLYLDSYPPGAAVVDLEQALAEVDATFAGAYGQLWPAASLVARSQNSLVGSIQVVYQSPWDRDLRCPFVIELFVGPAWRQRRIGATLLKLSGAVCAGSGESSMALRTAGENASPHALRLYRAAGMRPV